MCIIVKSVASALVSALLIQNVYAAEAGVKGGLLKLKEWLHERVETSGGTDATAASLSAYDTLVIGLGSPLSGEGWRLRLHHEAGFYEYASLKTYRRLNPATGRLIPGGTRRFAVTFLGDKESADIMAGVARRYGDLWLKVYAGAVWSRDRVSRDALYSMDGRSFSWDEYIIPSGDPNNPSRGIQWGGKVLGEMWMPLGTGMWASFDASMSTTGGRAAATARAGYDLRTLLPKVALSLGPEASAFRDYGGRTVRAGAFARASRGEYELTVSGGASGNYSEASSLYLSASLNRRF